MRRAMLTATMTAALAAAVSVPAFAQSEMTPQTTCAAFSDMAPADRTEAVKNVQTELEAGGMATSDQMSADEMTQKVASACKDKPDMTVGEAMGIPPSK